MKWFVALYPILPIYFAINISNSLPLISAGRIMLVILICLTFIKGKRVKRELANNENNHITQMLFIGLSLYVAAQFIVSVVHLTSSSIYNIFTLVLERIMLIYCIVCWVNTKEKIEDAIRLLVLASGIVCILAITEPFTNINLAYFLDTAGRSSVLKAGYYRNGLLRAEFSFGHPIALGMYTVLVFPFTMYFAGKERKVIYWLIAFVNIIANVLTSSRSTITIMMFVMIALAFMSDKKTKLSIFKLFIIAAFGCIFLMIINEKFLLLIISIFNETLAVFGLGTTTDKWNTISVRMTQWSVLNDILSQYPVLGAGIGYIQDNVVYYTNSNGNRGVMSSIDCEYLEQIIEGGVIGLMGFISLFASVIVAGFSKRLKRNKIARVFVVMFIGCLGCYISVSELKDQMIWLFYSLFIAYVIACGKKIINQEYNTEVVKDDSLYSI